MFRFIPHGSEKFVFLSFRPAFPINRIFLVLIALKFPIISCVVSCIFPLPRYCSEHFQNIFLSLHGFHTSGNRWLNDRDVGQSRYLERTCSTSTLRIINRKWTGRSIEPGPPRCEAAKFFHIVRN